MEIFLFSTSASQSIGLGQGFYTEHAATHWILLQEVLAIKKKKKKSAELILKLREDDLHSGARSSLINGW